MSPHFCPSCGFNLTRDETLTIGEWRLAPRWAERNGVAVRLRPQEAGMLYALARANGNAVTHEALADRTGEAEDAKNISRVVIKRLRKQLPGVPIQTIHGLGYRWAA